MTYSKPQISISTEPDRYSPAYGLNYFTFTASFVNTTAFNPFLIVDFNRLSQWNTASVLVATSSRYKVPMRENNKFIFNTEQIIKNYLTVPFNNKINGGSYSFVYVNEASGFGTATQSFPTIAPDTDTILKYNLSYGLEFNPGVTFGSISGITGSFGTVSIYKIDEVNLFCDAGDYIQVEMNSGIFNYYSGIQKVVAVTSPTGSTTLIFTDLIPNNTLLNITAVTASGYSTATGYIVNCKKIYGTTSQYSTWNGVRQWQDKGIDFTDLYLVQQNKETSFLENWGYDSTHAIPIAASHSYRARFLAEWQNNSVGITSSVSGGLSRIRWQTYNTAGVLVDDSSTTVSSSPDGTLLLNNCFTVAVVDGTDPIINDYKYKFSLLGSGNIIDTWAGTGTATPFSGEGVLKQNFNLNNPANITFNPNNSDKAYISHFFRISEVDLTTSLVRTITGASTQGTFSNCTASIARYFSPRKTIFLDTTEDFLILDTRDVGSPAAFYWRICKYSATASFVSELFVSSGETAYDMTMDAATKDLYVACYQPGIIYKVAAPLYNSKTLFYNPGSSIYGVAMDNNDLYFTLVNTNLIRKIPNLTPASVTTIGGDGTLVAVNNVLATLSGIDKPHAIEVYKGQLYYSDLDNALVRKIDLTTNIVTTLAGNNVATFGGDGGIGVSASLNKPFGLTIANNNLYIADTANSRIRVVGDVTLASLWLRGYDVCSQYQTIRLKWLNPLGSWSYWYFNKDLKQTSNINTTTYKTPYDYDYTLDFTDSNFTIYKLRGDSVLSKKINETFLLNSDWVNEDEYGYLNEIITSTQVFIFYDFWTDRSGRVLEAVNIPIIITDTTYEWKTRMRNKLFNLQLNYRLSYDTMTQNP